MDGKTIDGIVSDALNELSGYRIYPYPYQCITADSEYAETFAHNIEHYSKLMRFVPDLGDKKNILEIGVGFGYIAVMARRIFGGNVTATEHPSRKALMKNRIFLGKMKKEHIKFVPMDILKKFKFRNESFDLVFFSEILEHLAPTPDIISHVFGELRRITKKGGYLVLTTPNAATLDARWRSLRGRGVQPFPVQNKTDDTYEHIRVYCMNEVEIMMRKFGFEIVKTGHSNYYNGKFSSDLRRKILSFILPSLSSDLLVLGRKM
jgi:SAM-dependent methyltransferase